MDNRTIAQMMLEHARTLGGATNLYRVRAYRRAAMTLQGLSREAAEVLDEEGRAGLAKLPGIGAHLAYTIEALVRTGEFRTWKERIAG